MKKRLSALSNIKNFSIFTFINYTLNNNKLIFKFLS